MQFWSIRGCREYDAVRQLQLKLVELRALDQIPDTVLFLEHVPVITRGRGLQFAGAAKSKERHMPLPLALPSGVQFAESERGGDLTYHGPGQLVIYPICKLDGQGLTPRHDVAGFLRRYEEKLIQLLEGDGLVACVKENATGVWIGDKKIASIGIAIRKWVTYHGIAINVVNDLAPFFSISPCGFQPEVMTRLKDWVELGDDWRESIELRLAQLLDPHGKRTSGELEQFLAQVSGQAHPEGAAALDAF